MFRLNFRDHGDTHHLNRDLFHSCRIDEVVGAVRAVRRAFATDPVAVAGFSLGGNFALRVALHGPAGTNFDIGLSSLGVDRGGTSGPSSTDAYFTRYACREVHSENVTVKILRRSGYGRFSATVGSASPSSHGACTSRLPRSPSGSHDSSRLG